METEATYTPAATHNRAQQAKTNDQPDNLERELALSVYRLINSLAKVLKLYIDRKWSDGV